MQHSGVGSQPCCTMTLYQLGRVCMDRKHTEVERYIGQLTKEDEAIQAVGQLHSTKASG